MSQVSREQSLEVMAKLGTNVDWAQVDSEVIQRIIKDPTGSGREFTRFLANGGRVTIVSTGVITPKGDKTHVISVPVDMANLKVKIWRDSSGYRILSFNDWLYDRWYRIFLWIEEFRFSGFHRRK